jgi:hypothetical protein
MRSSIIIDGQGSDAWKASNHTDMPRFIALCPTCAHLLVNALAAKATAAAAADWAWVEKGADCASPEYRALERRAATAAELHDMARLYRAMNRESGWPKFGAGHVTRTEPTVDPEEFCPTFLPGPLDTPLTFQERERAAVTRACCHESRVRHMLNKFGVGL